MNPSLIVELAAKNGADLKAIINIIGIDKLIEIMPNVANLLTTIQAAQKVPSAK